MSAIDIAFVAGNRSPALFRRDPAFVYRCENIGLALAEQGHLVDFVHLKRFPVRKRPGAVVFHRPQASLRLWLLLRWLRRYGIPVVADVDDLVFDEAWSDYSPGVLNGIISPRVTRRRFRSHRIALSWFDGITVSTEPLADHVRRLFPDTALAVIPNCVHQTWERTEAAPSQAVEKVITYFPGTRSHDRDFEQIREPLTSFLRNHPEVQLQITGPLDFSLSAHPGQIVHHERVPYPEYQSRVRTGWVNLAPLEDTPFNRCKSALKVIEGGYWGIPTICSPNPDTLRLSGAGAVIAGNHGEWLESLERMLDSEYYSSITGGLRKRTMEVANIHEQAERFLRFVNALGP